MPSVIHVGRFKPNAMCQQSVAKSPVSTTDSGLYNANRPMENTEELRGRVLVFAANVPDT